MSPHPDNDSLTDLVARAGTDPNAFTALYRRLHGMVERYLGAHLPATVPDRADVLDDLCQDTWLKVWRSLAGLDPRNVAGWVMTVAHHTLIDWARRRARIRFVPWEGEKHERLLPDHADPARLVVAAEERAETRKRVRAALAALPDDARVSLLLAEQEGLGCEDQGRVTGLSRSAVKSRRFRDRDRARAVLAGVA